MENDQPGAPSEPAGNRKTTRLGWLLTVVGLVLLLAYDIYPLLTLSMRKEKLREIATPGRKFSDVLPVLEKEGYEYPLPVPTSGSFMFPLFVNNRHPVIVKVLFKIASKTLDHKTYVKFASPYLEAINPAVFIVDGKIDRRLRF